MEGLSLPRGICDLLLSRDIYHDVVLKKNVGKLIWDYNNQSRRFMEKILHNLTYITFLFIYLLVKYSLESIRMIGIHNE